jgi:transposase
VVVAERKKLGRNACCSLLIVDAQSVKNTDTAGSRGYDAGKKVSGIKRHIAVDTQGLPDAVTITTANVSDRQGALQALKRCKPNLTQVQSLLCDGGYTGEPFAKGVQDTLGEHVSVQIAKRTELHTFKVMPKRWIVERSFAWLEKNRRLWKNCERKLNTSLQFVHLAFLALLLRRS